MCDYAFAAAFPAAFPNAAVYGIAPCTVSETLTAGEFYRGSEPAQQSVSLPSPADTHYSRDCMLAYTRWRDVAVDGNARSILIVPVESDGV